MSDKPDLNPFRRTAPATTPRTHPLPAPVRSGVRNGGKVFLGAFLKAITAPLHVVDGTPAAAPAPGIIKTGAAARGAWAAAMAREWRSGLAVRDALEQLYPASYRTCRRLQARVRRILDRASPVTEPEEIDAVETYRQHERAMLRDLVLLLRDGRRGGFAWTCSLVTAATPLHEPPPVIARAWWERLRFAPAPSRLLTEDDCAVSIAGQPPGDIRIHRAPVAVAKAAAPGLEPQRAAHVGAETAFRKPPISDLPTDPLCTVAAASRKRPEKSIFVVNDVLQKVGFPRSDLKLRGGQRKALVAIRAGFPDLALSDNTIRARLSAIANDDPRPARILRIGRTNKNPASKQ